jgi:hypothetical protein
VIRSKVLLLGESKVGKSAIVQMVHRDGIGYPKEYLMNTSVELCVKAVKIPQTETMVELHLLDSAGSPIFNQREHGTTHVLKKTVICNIFT